MNRSSLPSLTTHTHVHISQISWKKTDCWNHSTVNYVNSVYSNSSIKPGRRSQCCHLKIINKMTTPTPLLLLLVSSCFFLIKMKKQQNSRMSNLLLLLLRAAAEGVFSLALTVCGCTVQMLTSYCVCVYTAAPTEKLDLFLSCFRVNDPSSLLY